MKERRTVIVNGQTVPAPMNRLPEIAERFYVLDVSEEDLADYHTFTGHEYDHNSIRFGWFDNEHDASKYFKALLGVE